MYWITAELHDGNLSNVGPLTTVDTTERMVHSLAVSGAYSKIEIVTDGSTEHRTLTAVS